MRPGKIFIGTSGWHYKHWKKTFYPEEVKVADYLSYYAQYFATTEINASFYKLPLVSTVEDWANTVNARFRFCPKISRYVTHTKKLNDPAQTLPRFFEVFDRVIKKLGPVLLQLPPNLHYHEERAITFFDALVKYKGYHFALEPRHESWMTPAAIKLLKKYKIAFVIAESGDRFPSGEFITAKNIYIRFHGPKGDYASGYSATYLQRYAEKISQWQQAGHHIWVFFNNDVHGYAIRNALTLIDYINRASG